MDMKLTLSAAMLLAITSTPVLADNLPETVNEPTVTFETATNNFLQGLNFPPYVIGENSCYIPASSSEEKITDPTEMLLSRDDQSAFTLVT